MDQVGANVALLVLEAVESPPADPGGLGGGLERPVERGPRHPRLCGRDRLPVQNEIP